jgi:thioredoxin reductase (NADPH)
MADDETAFPTLDATQISFLETLGERQSMGAGEYLYRSGDDAYDFFVIVSGQVDILLDGDGQDRLITQHGAGRFLGELNLLTGQRVYVSARVSQPGVFLRVPARVIRQVIATDARLGDTILTAYMARRDILLSGAASSIRLLGSRYRAETHALREFLTRSRIPHEWLDPESDESVERLVDQLGIACTDLPVVIMSGAVLTNATPGSMAEYLGLTVDRLPDRCFDLLIVGGGAAGLAAAVYGASEGLSTLAVESLVPGGQAGTSSRIENYLGFPTGISGGDLTQRAFVQAEKFGAHVTSPCAATSLREAAGHLIVGLADGTDVAGRAVIAATGARYRRLPVDGREALEGNGVYYAATDLEARVCAGKGVIVVGGGNSAGQAALYLAQQGCAVSLVVRRPDLSATMSRYLIERIQADPRITLLTGTEVRALAGGEHLEQATAEHTPSGERQTVGCAGLFCFIGAEPASGWLGGAVALDDHGFVLTDRSLPDTVAAAAFPSREPLPFETSVPGVFAVGDVRHGSMKRVAAAVGEGSSAVRSVHDHLATVA